MFNIVWRKQATVAEILGDISLNLSSRRSLDGNKLRDWQLIVSRVANINTNDGQDIFFWLLLATWNNTIF